MPPIQLRHPFGYNFYETCLYLIVVTSFSALAQEGALNTCHFNEFNEISSCRKPSFANRSVSLPFPQVNCSEDNESQNGAIRIPIVKMYITERSVTIITRLVLSTYHWFGKHL